MGTKQFQPHETLVFVRLVKWALKALDIYTLNVGPQPTGIQRLNQQTVRSKEEKEVLEHFSGVVSSILLELSKLDNNFCTCSSL